MQNLFQVNTTIAELDGCKDVIIHWYFDQRRDAPLVPYADAIEDYDPRAEDVRYSEDALNEYFSQAEAEAILSWLVRTRPDDRHEARAIRLPIAKIMIGFGHIPVGGPQDTFTRAAEDGRSFTISGYYDLRDHAPAYGRDADLARRKAFTSGTLLIDTDAGTLTRASDLEEIAPLH